MTDNPQADMPEEIWARQDDELGGRWAKYPFLNVIKYFRYDKPPSVEPVEGLSTALRNALIAKDTTCSEFAIYCGGKEHANAVLEAAKRYADLCRGGKV